MAESHYRKSIQQNINYSEAYFNLGLLLYNDSDEEKQYEGLSFIRQAMDKGNARAKEFLIMNELM